MNQGALIVMALAGGFVLYLLANGRLSTYAGAMIGQTPDLPTVRGGGGGP